MRAGIASAAALVATLTYTAHANDWPQFRGRNASGVAGNGAAPPLAWSLD